MAGYLPGEQPREPDRLIKLNTNEHPYGPSPQVLKAIRQAATSNLRRYPDPMAERFRQAAAELYGLEPDWILAGNGSDDLLTIITRSFVDQGAFIVAPTPSYLLYRTLAEVQGAAYREVPFDEQWDLPDRFASGGATLAFLANPNSPSGTALKPARVAELARQAEAPLVVDEAYAEFADSNCIELVRRCENVIVTRSLSKSYGLAGIRFGYALAQPHIIAGLSKVKDSYNCDSLNIVAATAAIQDQAYLHHCLARIRHTRDRLAHAMRRLGFSVPDSQANFVWCAEGPVAAKAIYEQLKSRGILVRYMNYPGHGDGLRITVGTDEEIDALLGAVTEIVGR